MRNRCHYKSVITDNAEKILQDRYYLKDEQGNCIENFDQLCKRIAKTIAAVEATPALRSKYESKFYGIFHNLDFVPNTPTIVNAGKKSGLSACYVVPMENTYGKIIKSLQDVALIFKSGGGVGFNFSWIGLPAFYQTPVKFNVWLDKDHPDYQEFLHTDFKNLIKLSGYTSTNSNSFEENYTDNYHVLHIADSLKEIFNFRALIDRENRITAIDFSAVRAKDSLVNSTKGIATGPVSFMKAWDAVIEFLNNEATPINAIKMFDACTGAISQGGVRRGACMGILNVDHKDIYDFISCKDDQSVINNFNLSVGVIKETLFNSENFNLKDYITGEQFPNKYNSEQMLKYISAHAWGTGEPGIIFLDRINQYNPINVPVVSTNPCKHTAPSYRNIC